MSGPPGGLRICPFRCGQPSIGAVSYLRKASGSGAQSPQSCWQPCRSGPDDARAAPSPVPSALAAEPPTGCLQPVGLARDFVALDPACCTAAASKKRTFKTCSTNSGLTLRLSSLSRPLSASETSSLGPDPAEIGSES